MNNLNAMPVAQTTLFFQDKSVQAFTFEPGGVPHFSVFDICAAMGLHAGSASALDRPSFPAHGKRLLDSAAADSPHFGTVLTPVGVWYFTTLVDPRRGERIAAWAKREARKACPDICPGDPSMFLTLDADAELPPRPTKYSGWRAEWYALKDSPEYRDGAATRLKAREKQFIRAADYMIGLDAALADLKREMLAEKRAAI